MKNRIMRVLAFILLIMTSYGWIGLITMGTDITTHFLSALIVVVSASYWWDLKKIIKKEKKKK